MSIASMLTLFAFLGFFFVVLPFGLYLFARFFPKKLPSFIGFPQDGTVSPEAPAKRP